MLTLDLGAHSIKALVERTGFDPAAVDDVVFGCVQTLGPQPAISPHLLAGRRHARARARRRWSTASAARAQRADPLRRHGRHERAAGDLVVAGGVQNLNLIPISGAMLAGQQYGFPDPFRTSPGWLCCGDQEVGQFRSTEMIAESAGR